MRTSLVLALLMICVTVPWIGLRVAVASSEGVSQRASQAKPVPSPTPTTQASLPARSGQLNDFAHALNEDTRQQVEQALIEFKKRSQIDFVVVLVNSTEGKPIGEQAKALFQGWNVGGGTEGLMLLFATDDRQWRLHSNRAVTRDLPEDKIREVGTSMNPSLAREHYNDAVRRGVETVIKILAAKRGFAPIKIPAPLLPS